MEKSGAGWLCGISLHVIVWLSVAVSVLDVMKMKRDVEDVEVQMTSIVSVTADDRVVYGLGAKANNRFLSSSTIYPQVSID